MSWYRAADWGWWTRRKLADLGHAARLLVRLVGMLGVSLRRWRLVVDQVRQSSDPLVHQFVTAAPDGPVRFHHPGPDVASDFGASAQSQPRGRA